MKLPIASIRTGERYRKDMGDVDGLAASIRERGLLHPVVVNGDNLLIAGGRRLEAVKRLGWSEVPVTVIASITDAQALLEAERDENACREDMKPSEYVALGLALEELEKPKAEARKAEGNSVGGKGGKSVVNDTRLPSDRPIRTHDEVAKALGVGGSTYLRARKVVQASEDETLPEEVRTLAQEAREEMDATGKVNPAFNKVAKALDRRPTHPVEPEAAAAPYRPETDRQRQFAEAQKRRLVAALSGVSGFCKGLGEIDLRKAVAACSDEEVAMWAKIAGECARDLRNLRNNLNGSTSHEPAE